MRILFSILAVFAAVVSCAQVITQSANEPAIGDVDKNFKLDTSAYTMGMPTAVTGSNVSWDFTKLTGIFPVVIDSFISPLAATGASDYPTATFAQHRDFLYTFFKSTQSPSQTELLGAWSPSLTITFTNSAIIAAYPVGFGYQLVDPVSGGFKYGTYSGACNGSITITADATGMVHFPNGVSYANVIRLKSVEQLTMSIGIFPAGSIHQTVYNYYAPGRKFPVLSLNYTRYALLAGTPTITTLAYGTFSNFPVAGIDSEEALESAPTIYPNPFGDALHVRPASEGPGTVIEIFDVSGRLALRTEEWLSPDVRGLTPGAYELRITHGGRVSHHKVVKE